MDNRKYPTKTKAEEILDSMRAFTDQHFDAMLNECAEQLLIRVQKNWQLNIFQGRAKHWAAGVVYVLARYNLLFDKSADNHVTPESISEHYAQTLDSIRKRADRIETACGLKLGEPSISCLRIYSMINFFTTTSGFVVPKLSIDSCIQNLKESDTIEAHWAEKQIAELIDREKSKYLDRQYKMSLKNAHHFPNQLDLFGK